MNKGIRSLKLLTPNNQLFSGKAGVPLLMRGLDEETGLREVRTHSPSHTSWVESEAVGESSALPGRRGSELQVGLPALVLSCCVALGKLPPSLNSISSPGVALIATPTF